MCAKQKNFFVVFRLPQEFGQMIAMTTLFPRTRHRNRLDHGAVERVVTLMAVDPAERK